MAFSEDDLIPISALQHYLFCRRQCALIHVEQIWTENVLTMEGRILHEKVHESDTESRSGVRIVRGLRIHSVVAGLIGQADVVEFVRSESGIPLEGFSGFWQPYPVEFKRGKPKGDAIDEVQLCAQAICLEEMLKVEIRKGAFFYGTPRRRHEIFITPSLRGLTMKIVMEVRGLFASGNTPTAKYQKKCRNCSLYAECLPKTTGSNRNIGEYLKKAFTFSTEEPPG
jgi:CRISPR-associated exonuclease Cas4